MIEMKVDSVRINLATQSRVVILKDIITNRYLFIWVAPTEAYAISVCLHPDNNPRPLTHNLIKEVITKIGGTIKNIQISGLIDDIFYANIVIDTGGKLIAVDSRPSDAIAIALTTNVSIYVSEIVLEKAGVTLDQDNQEETDQKTKSDNLNAYRDFINNLDALDDFGKNKDK